MVLTSYTLSYWERLINLKHRNLYAALVLVLAGFITLKAQTNEICGTCRVDNGSVTGASQFCKYGNAGYLKPCKLEAPPPTPALLSGADLNLTDSDIPVCQPIHLDRWNNIVDNQLSVRGFDIVGSNIRYYPAERKTLINNWYPLDIYKQTLCGKLQRFKTHHHMVAEDDWNNFIIPDPSFESLYTDALPFKSDGIRIAFWVNTDWKKCGDSDLCIEAEVTPDEAFFENPWFPMSTQISPLENSAGLGPTICTYGPWVRERVHGNRPEIHPSELYWWKEKIGESDLFWLLQLDDDSNRFDVPGDFDFGGEGDSPPLDWRPWAAAPRHNTFSIAFELDPRNEILTFNVGQSHNRFVKTKDYSVGVRDNSNSKYHAITYNGRTLLQVFELQPDDEDINVGFVGICKNILSGNIQGYLQIGTSVSESSRRKEGFHAIWVSKTKTLSSTSTLRPPVTSNFILHEAPQPKKKLDPFVSSELLANTMRPGIMNGKNSLFADIAVQFHDSQISQTSDFQVQSVNYAGNDLNAELTYYPNSKSPGGIVSNVPLNGEGELEFASTDEKLKLRVDGIQLVPIITKETISKLRSSEKGWVTMSASAGGQSRKDFKPFNTPHVVEQLQIETAPIYATTKDGQTSLEDISPWIERINSVLQKRGTENQELFVNEPPIRVSWKFTATNLANGKVVPVKTTKRASSSEISVAFSAGIVPNSTVQIYFPADLGENVYEVNATVMMEDSFGNSGKNSFKLVSHVIPIEGQKQINSLLNTVSNLTGVSNQYFSYASNLTDLPKQEVDHTIESVILRRARMIRLYAHSASEDGVISFDELEILIKSMKLFGDRF